MKVVVDALVSPSLTVTMFSVDVMQQLKKKKEADLFRAQEVCSHRQWTRWTPKAPRL